METVADIPMATISCPRCSNNITYYDAEGSNSWGCSSCHSFFTKHDNGQMQVLKHFSIIQDRPVLKIGSKCSFDGVAYYVRGWVQKWDAGQQVNWKEYFLYDPTGRETPVIAETHGEWLYVWLSEEQEIRLSEPGIFSPGYNAIQEVPYRKYAHSVGYYYEILYAEGSFDTNIIADEHKLRVEEYVNEADMLVSEQMGDTTTWYRGVWLSQAQIAEAFDMPITEMPTRFAIGSIRDVSSFYRKWPVLWNFTTVAVVLVLLIQLASMTILKPSRTLLNEAYNTQLSSASWGSQMPIDAGVIDVKSARSPLYFKMETDVHNNWMELNVTLVNTKTGKTYEFTKAIEEYSGYESGEHWTEGSSDVSATLSGVEAGSYQVNLYPYSDASQGFLITLNIEQNTVLYSNLLLALVAILVYPVIQYNRKRNFEA